MTRLRLIRLFLFSFVLLAVVIGACGLWIWSQERQYVLNRELITALVHHDVERALVLVNEGADPNTRYYALPVPSLKQLWNRVLHRTPLPIIASPTAFLIACGSPWNDVEVNGEFQEYFVESPPLVRAMLMHGANPEAQTTSGKTALHLVVRSNCWETMRLLLEHGVNVNTEDDDRWTALSYAIYYDADEQTIRQLLAYGANPNLATREGDNALSLAKQKEQPGLIALLLEHGAKWKKPNPSPAVPAIARLLGVRVGWNGQDALFHQFGEGLHTVGGHPGGCVHWNTRQPSGCIETDGFNYNGEGLVLESLYWGCGASNNPSTPFVRSLPHHAGWLGVIYPGMTTQQVSQRIAGRAPSPQKQGSIWTWKAQGFVRTGAEQYDVYTTWTARLTFQNGRLSIIEVNCDGELSAP